MALIICPECGKEFSDKAKACPNCACPIEEIIGKNSENMVCNMIPKYNFVQCKDSDVKLKGSKKITLGKYSGKEEAIIIPSKVNFWEDSDGLSLSVKALRLNKDILIKTTVKRELYSGSFDRVFPSHLEWIEVEPENPYYASRDGMLLSKDYSHLLYCPPKLKMNSYTIPEDVTYINESAFCSSVIRNLILHSNMEFGRNCFGEGMHVEYPSFSCINHIPENYFNNNLELEEFVFPENITSFGEYAFEGCKNLKRVVFNSHISTIPRDAFYHCGLEEFTFPEEITSFGMGAFSGCKELKRVVFNDHITTIPDYAFWNCGLEEFTFPEEIVSFGDSAFSGCKELKRVVFNSRISTIPKYAFSNDCLLEEIIIPEGVKVISDGAFSGCCNLKKIKLPESLEEIRYHAFFGCKSLTSVGLPEGLKIIEGDVFTDTNIEELVIPSSIENVGNLYYTAKYKIIADCNNAEIKKKVAEHERYSSEMKAIREKTEKLLVEVNELFCAEKKPTEKLNDLIANRKAEKDNLSSLRKHLFNLHEQLDEKKKVLSNCSSSLFGRLSGTKREAEEEISTLSRKINDVFNQYSSLAFSVNQIPDSPYITFDEFGNYINVYKSNGIDGTFAIDYNKKLYILNAFEIKIQGSYSDYGVDASQLDKAIMTGIAADPLLGYIATGAAKVYNTVDEVSIQLYDHARIEFIDLVLGKDFRLDQQDYLRFRTHADMFIYNLTELINNIVDAQDQKKNHEKCIKQENR